MSELKFCPAAEFEDELVSLIHQNIINISEQEISKLYSLFKETYDCIGGDNKLTTQNKQRISEKQNNPEGTALCGIDFPSWFNTPSNNKKIMIIGIDPLRNEKVFKDVKANRNNDVIIGTPYALHNMDKRQGKTKQYFEFIKALSEMHFVYLTDIFKSFFYTDAEKSSDYFLNNKMANHLEILKQEINLIKPDLIITLGGASYFHLTNEKLALSGEIIIKEHCGIKVMPMVHLSGSTRQKHKVNFLLNNKVNLVDKNFGKGYSQIVENYLYHI